MLLSHRRNTPTRVAPLTRGSCQDRWQPRFHGEHALYRVSFCMKPGFAARVVKHAPKKQLFSYFVKHVVLRKSKAESDPILAKALEGFSLVDFNKIIVDWLSKQVAKALKTATWHVVRTLSSHSQQLSGEQAHHGPLMFHCTHGKDRTGLVAALLLHTLGVSEDRIADDYAVTQELLPPNFTENVPQFLKWVTAVVPPFACFVAHGLALWSGRSGGRARRA